MRKNVLVIAFLIALVAPAVAQKAQIEAVNAKWMELFNKGDFQGIAELYTVDAIAFPPGSAMVEGKLQSAQCGKAWRSKRAIRKSPLWKSSDWVLPQRARSGPLA